MLIDFENVQPKDVTALNGGQYSIKVFLGAQQGKVPLKLAQALQALGPQAEYIQINGNGSNAVDFHIAYYIGRLAAAAPHARFHVISRDTGFDPLLRHLNEQSIVCQRVVSLSALAPTKKNPSGDRVATIVQNLAKRKSAKPATLKALRATIQALFEKGLVATEVDALVEQLAARGVIKVSAGKVHYQPQGGEGK